VQQLCRQPVKGLGQLGGVAPQRTQPADHTNDVAVNSSGCIVEGDAGHCRCGVGANTGDLTHLQQQQQQQQQEQQDGGGYLLVNKCKQKLTVTVT